MAMTLRLKCLVSVMVYIGKEDKVSLNCPKAGIPDWPWNYHRM